MRDGRLEGIEAIVQRQQRMLSEHHDDRLVLDGRTVDLGSRGPVGRSATEPRFFHFATVLGLMP